MASEPIFTLHKPVVKNGLAYGALTFYLRGKPVQVIARTDQALIAELYRWVQRYVSFSPQAVTMQGFAATKADVARNSDIGRFIADRAKGLPSPYAFESDRERLLASVLRAAGVYDRDDAWQGIYELCEDADSGDEASLQWLDCLESLLRSADSGGASLGALPAHQSHGPSLLYTALSILR